MAVKIDCMNILDLPYLTVTKTELKEHGYEVYAEVATPPAFCPHCGSAERNLSKYGTKQQVFMDLPMHGKQVGIIIDRQRYKCKDCGSTFREILWDIDDDHMCTIRFREYVEKQSLKRTFVHLAHELGVSEGTIRYISKAYIDRLEAERDFVTPTWLGIDELHILGKPRGVLTNIEQGTLYDLLEDRNKVTVARYLDRMPDKQNIQVVTMDMWNPYRQAVYETLPNAEVVVDKFHVVRMGNQAVETIRKQIRKELDDKPRRQLKNDRFLMLRRRKDLSPMEQMVVESWTLNYPKLKLAYDLKEDFYDIWDSTDAQEAQERYLAWQASIPDGMKAAFHDITRAYANWHHEINNYFTHRVTNAYTESVNGLTRVVNRMGRGYSFKVLRARMLYSEGAKKTGKPTNYKKAMQQSGFMNRMTDFFGENQQQEIVYGADISILTKLIEEERL